MKIQLMVPFLMAAVSVILALTATSLVIAWQRGLVARPAA
jgi:hypothetical protein